MRGTLHSPRYDEMRQLLKRYREASNLTQQDVATKLRKPQSYVAKYEKGERRIDLIEFIDIARAIGFDPAELIAALG